MKKIEKEKRSFWEVLKSLLGFTMSPAFIYGMFSLLVIIGVGDLLFNDSKVILLLKRIVSGGEFFVILLASAVFMIGVGIYNSLKSFFNKGYKTKKFNP